VDADVGDGERGIRHALEIGAHRLLAVDAGAGEALDEGRGQNLAAQDRGVAAGHRVCELLQLRLNLLAGAGATARQSPRRGQEGEPAYVAHGGEGYPVKDAH
jgi:hypothetical protein